MQTPIATTLHNALIGASVQPTKERAISTRDWAGWLKFQTLDDPDLEALAGCCARWVRRMKDDQGASWLSLLGKTGTGKTHCASRCWKWASGRFDWQRCEFVHAQIYWPEFVSDLRAGIAWDRLRDMTGWPVLFLDDIGAERDTSGFASEQLNMLLGCRVGKWTILSSNLGLDQIGAMEPRIADRIIREPGNEFHEVTADSYALRKLKTT